MHKRKYRILSLIFVTVLLLAGAYHDKVAEDTFLLRGCMEDSAICSGVFHAEINDVAACMTEMPGGYSGMEQSSTELDPLLYLLCSNQIFLFAGKSFGSLKTEQSLCDTLDELVMEYLHQSDGKKRNEHYLLHII